MPDSYWSRSDYWRCHEAQLSLEFFLVILANVLEASISSLSKFRVEALESLIMLLEILLVSFIVRLDKELWHSKFLDLKVRQGRDDFSLLLRSRWENFRQGAVWIHSLYVWSQI